MSSIQRSSRPLTLCLRCSRQTTPKTPSLRAFSSTTSNLFPEDVSSVQQPPSDPPPPPSSTSARADETTKHGDLRTSIPGTVGQFKGKSIAFGSRRLRAARATIGKDSIPFEQLPFQCFQEARKVLAKDREEKIQKINQQRERIQRLSEQDVTAGLQDEDRKTKALMTKEKRLKSMRATLEELKIHADINDPIVKKRFEDGLGDMSKPIYRFLADRKWRSYRRKIVEQRITQMAVIPDVLPVIDLVADVTLAFGRRDIKPGDWVPSMLSETPAKLNVQVFDKGERLVTVAIMDSDVADVEKDGFEYRSHGLWCNVKISPTEGAIDLGMLSPEHQVFSYLPPFAQKGAPYHRISVFIMQQDDGKIIDVAQAKERFAEREGFRLRSLVTKYHLKPVGATMFRCNWDENTAKVMERSGVQGADVEYKVKRIEKLPYKKKKSERFR